MYNPARFRSTDLDEVFELMNRYPFATVISVAEGQPFVSHLPLTADRVSGKIELIGHIARANPHSKSLAQSPATVIFNGPHTYITPKWYLENDVPTWNYVTAHVTGKVDLIESYDGIVECLKILASHAERLWPSEWEFFVPENLTGESLTKSIVGFRIAVAEINFKKKLNQNRSSEDQESVMRGLESRTDESSRAILAEMKKL